VSLKKSKLLRWIRLNPGPGDAAIASMTKRTRTNDDATTAEADPDAGRNDESPGAPDRGRASDGESQPDTDGVGTASTYSDPIGVVSPDTGGDLAALVNRSLGQGDTTTYGPVSVRLVKQLQEAAGLEPDGIVSGQTWALILRTLKPGAMGQEVQILRRLLDLNWWGAFDDEVLDALGAAGHGAAVVDEHVWSLLIGNALSESE
jgi:murein L,D-transpeptidase YcbB/YkuD